MLSESTICLFHPTQIIVVRILFVANLWAIHGNSLKKKDGLMFLKCPCQNFTAPAWIGLDHSN